MWSTLWSALPLHCRTLLALGIALASAGMPFGPAQAQGKLTANYTITIARIPIGKIAWTVDIGEASYVTTGSGEASGLLSILASGKGTASTRGIVEGGKLSPTSYTSDITRDDDKAALASEASGQRGDSIVRAHSASEDIRAETPVFASWCCERADDTRPEPGSSARVALQVTLDRGVATDVTGQAREASDARVPLSEAHRRDIVDPLTAFLIPADAGDGVTRTACERTLPIFDGHRRFNLKLAFKRMDKVTLDKRDAVPAVVCTVTFEAVAGHRADSKLVKFLSQDRDIELWLTPVAGARVLAPLRAPTSPVQSECPARALQKSCRAGRSLRSPARRLSIAHLLGNLVVQTTEFQASASVPRHPAIATDARAD